MVKAAGYALIVLGIVHMLVLGIDLPGEAPRWLGLNLWTFDHWQSMRTQEVDLALSNGVFWATIGSLAIPLMLIGWIVLVAEQHGWALPPALGWLLAAWAALCVLLMPPSGFPLVLIVALMLGVGLQRRAVRGNS